MFTVEIDHMNLHQIANSGQCFRWQQNRTFIWIFGGEKLRVIELIKQLEKLGYTDKTQICFGFLNKYEGEFYETDIVRIDDEDRDVGDDCITVRLDRPDDYIKSEVQCVNQALRDEIIGVINRRI